MKNNFWSTKFFYQKSFWSKKEFGQKKEGASSEQYYTNATFDFAFPKKFG